MTLRNPEILSNVPSIVTFIAHGLQLSLNLKTLHFQEISEYSCPTGYVEERKKRKATAAPLYQR